MKTFYSCLRKLFILSFILVSANSFAQKESESPVVKEMTGRKFITDIPRNQTPFTPQPDAPTVIINVPANYPTIQAAINAANNGDIITIDAGVYKENITLNKYLRLRGANYGVNPNTGSRGPETVIHPATSDPDPLSPTAITYFYITPGGSSSTIDGITFDGNNPTISTGFSSNGVDIDACEAIGAYDGISNVIVSNNIFVNIYYAAIDFYNATNGGASTYDNLVTNNKFDNINPPSYGIGVIIYNNCYTTASYNVMTRIRVGVQTGNFYNADIGTNHSIDHNNFETYRRGIWNNLSYTNATAYDITNNELTTVSGATNNEGIEISSIQSSVGVNVSNNNITGARIGYNLWNCPTTNTVTVTGGVITNCKIGVFPNNYDGYPPGAPDPSVYAMTGITMTNCDTAIWVRDNNLNTNGATVALSINNTTNIVNGTGLGLVVEGGDASVSFSAGDPIDFNTTLSKYIRLITNGSNVPSANINAQDVKFGGTKGSNSTNAQLFAIEDKIDHKIDWNSLGFVSVKATNKYVTINSFYPPNTSAASIQKGIDISTAGDTVNIGTATFNDTVNLNKAVTLAGSGPASTILTPTVACTVDGITISSSNANVKDLRVTNYIYGLRTSASTINIYNVVSDLNCQSGLNTANGTNGLSIVKCKFNNNASAGWRAGTGDNVSNVIMDSSEAKGNTSVTNGFGIAIFASTSTANTFDNITIKNSDFSNNLKKGMYFEKLSNAMIDNVKIDNSGTDATYGFNNGIDINLKNGAYTNITIQNSSITNCGSTGTAGNVDNPAALAIKARDDAPDYNTNPATLTGFTLKNCFITGPNNGLRFGEFNKVNNSPTGNTVIENHFGGAYSNKAILNKTANPISVSCNWYGTVSATAVAALNGAGINYTPYLTDGNDNSINPGFQIVPGSCNGPFTSIYVNDNSLSGDHYTTAVGNNSNPGTPGSPYATINFALSNSIAGDTIWVDAGTYIEDVVANVNNISLRGSNYLINPNTGSRVAESIVMPATNDPVSGVLISLLQSNVTMDGFLFNGDNPLISGGQSVGSADVNTSEGIANATDAYNGPFYQIDHINIQNNIFNNFSYQAVFFWEDFNSNHSWNYVKNNKFDNMWEGVQTYAMHTDISLNTFTRVDRALSMHGVHAAADPGFVPQIANNTISITWKTGYSRNMGIWVNYRDGNAPALEVKNNTINCSDASLIGKNFYGFYALTIADNRILTFSNNTITGAGNCSRGFYMSACPSSNVRLSGGAFNDIRDYGIFMTNFDPTWLQGDSRLTVDSLPVTMSPGSTAGVWVYTNNSYANNPTNSNLTVKRVGRNDEPVADKSITEYPNSSPNATLVSALNISHSAISGGSTGIMVVGTLASANIHDNPSSITGAVIGVDVDGGSAALYRNSITANGTGVRVKNSGKLDSATQNYITSNTGDGINIEATAGTIGVITNNNLSGNTLFAINYLKPTPALSANCNWYGGSDAITVISEINGNVTFSPWLTSSIDYYSDTAGFQMTPGSCNGLQTKYYVNDNSLSGDVYTTAVGNDANFGTPGAPFATIVHAITVANPTDSIIVDAGTYVEQLNINKSLTIIGADSAGPNASIIKAPAVLSPVANANAADHTPVVYASGTGNIINMSQICVDGDGRGGARFYGVYYYEAGGRFEHSRITKVRDPVYSGVQSGDAFFANHAYDVVLDHTVTVNDNLIDDYQKTGILINELNTEGIVTNNIVIGQNIQHVNGENGIQFGYGAYGTITGNNVSNNLYNGPSPDAASGILLAGVGVNQLNVATGKTTTVGGAGALMNNMNGNEVGLLTDGGGFGYDSNQGVIYNANTFSNNDIHASESSPNTVPSASNTYDKRVDNTVQTNIVYGRIMRAVNDATSGHTLIVSAGTFPENVTLSKTLTINGAKVGIDARGRVVGAPNPLTESVISPVAGAAIEYVTGCSNTIIDGFALQGSVLGTRGVMQTLTTALTNLTIRNNYVAVTSTVGSAFWFDKSITDATIDKNELIGASATVQVVYLDASDQFHGIYFTYNNVLRNGAPVGSYGLFVDGNRNVGTSATPRNPLFKGNLFTGHQTAINSGSRSFLNLQFTENTITGNTAEGFQGGPKNSSFSRNTFSSNGLRGIAFTSFGNLAVDRGAQGDTVKNNFFFSNTSSDMLFSNQGTGTQNSNIITNNSFLSTVAIRNNELDGGTDVIHADCNWFGTSSPAVITTKIINVGGGIVDFIPFLNDGTDSEVDTAGFQPVPNTCVSLTSWYVNDNVLTGDHYTTAIGNDGNPGTSNSPFATINHAIAVSANGDTIFVDAGTFVENVVVNKYNLSIRGSNFGINPNTGSRLAESIVMPATNDPVYGVLINIQKSKTYFDGFLLNGDNPGLSGGTTVGSADVNTSEGICNGPAIGPYYQIDTTNIRNNTFNNFDYQAIYLEVDFNTNHSWNYIRDNKFDNMWEGIQTYALHTDISSNVFTAVDRALSIHGTNVACDPGFVPRIDSNEVTISWKNPSIPTRNTAIWVNYRRGTAPALSVNRNTIHYPTAAPSGKRFMGFYALTITDDRTVTFSNNTIDGQGNCSRGFYMSNCPSSNVSLTGGAFNNIKDHGIMMVNNDPSWGAGDVRLTVSGLPITMSPGSYAGVLDSTDNSFAMNALGNDILEKRMNRNEPVAIEPEVKSDGVKTSSTAYLAALDISNSSISGSETGIKVTGTNASANIHDNPTTITGAVIGVDINGGTAAIYRNNITANGTGVRVKNSGNLDSATENYITSNTVEGVTIEADAGSIGIISYNDLSGNTGFAINYLKATPALSALCNWYGVTNGVLVASKINGNVNYVSWLTSGFDNSPTAGFQPVPGSCNGMPETKLYVNDNSTSGDVFTTAVGSNSNPGTAALPFLTITYAVSIANPTDTILVDAGTYQEQVISNKSLTITGADSAGSSAAIIKAPLVMSTVANANAADHTPIVYFSGASTTVNINHIGIDGDGRGGAKFSGVYYFEASGTFTNSRIEKVRDAAFSGVQSGNAFFANHTYDVSLSQTVTVADNVIEDYQKTGILINELNTHGIVTNNIVTGQSIQHVNGQNGIQFGYGSYGTITGNTVTGNQYNGPSPDAASGILLAGVGVDQTNTPTGNTTTVGGAGSLANNMSADEVGLLVDGGGFGYDSNSGVIYNANNFANNYIHVSESAPNTVPSGSNVYDKRIDNTSQTNVVYGQIQRSVDDASANNILNVSAHTFTEQVEIHKALTLAGQGMGLTTILSPNILPISFLTPSVNKPVVYVHDTSDVIIKNLTVDGAGKGNANNRFEGIAYRNAGGTVSHCEIKAIRNTPIDGIQAGVGIYAFDNNGTARTLNVIGNNIYDFQKNATALSGVDLTTKVDSNTITGAGPVTFIAQNGIQIGFSAAGSARNNIVSGFSYTPGPDVATGILMFQPTGPDTTSNNTVSACQMGIYFKDVGGVIRENTISATAVNTGTTDYFGIDADPGDSPARVKANPFDVDENTTKTKVNISNSPSSLTTSIYRNTLTSDGTNGTGIKMDVYGTETLNGTATENKVNGWDKGILFYKDAGATLNGVANDNDLSGNTYALYNLSGVAQNGTCNWFGTTYPAGVAAKVSGTVTYTPFLTNGTDNAPAISGFQPVPGSCNGPSPKLYVNDNSLTGDIYTTAVGNDANVGSPSAPFRTIAHAILFANNGDSIIVDAGSYTENDSVYKSVTIIGAGQGATIVSPLISGPTCGGGSLCPGGSNVMLIGADNVSIRKMTIDGNNPSLTSGVVVAGVDIDARNGIITNHTLGTFNNLRVDSVTVKNIYLRGIYASSGGTFTFSNDSADNIQGDPGSIAMFNFGGAGVFANNTVSNANDAISSNHSTGSVYYGNSVESSGSGIHTDNNGDGGGIADTIRNNTVSNSDLYGYGIWVFAPYKSVVVKDNTITNVDVGLANAGQGVPVTTTFTQNTVDGQNKANSAGVYQTTSLFGFGSSTVSGIYTNNFIKNNVDGFYVEYEPGNTNNINANDNTIKGNTNGVTLAPGGTLVNDFTCNWWGSATAGDVSVAVSAPVNYIFYLTNGTDNDGVAAGFQPVPGSCNGQPLNVNYGTVDTYSYANSTDGASGAPSQPEFCWKDTTGSTNLVSNAVNKQPGIFTGDLDDGYWKILLPAGKKVRFFGTDYDTLRIGTNGIIAFKIFNPSGGNNNPPASGIPGGTVTNAFYPFWWDQNWGVINSGTTTNRLSYKVVGNQLIVTYDRAPRYAGAPGDYVSYQVCIDVSTAPASNSRLLVQFADTSNTRTGSLFASKYNLGLNQTHLVGLQNSAATSSIQYRFANSTPTVITAGPLFDTLFTSMAVQFGSDNTQLNQKCQSLSLTFRLQAIQLTRKDTVTVMLRSSTLPYPVIESKKVVYDSLTGTATVPYSLAENGSSYYIFVSHRNSISTWSAAPVSCTSNALTYDFTTALTQAYSNNMVMVSGKASFFTGEVDSIYNGNVGLTDLANVYNDNVNFVSGSYVKTDVNYNGIVDLSDIVYVFNNASLFVVQKNPPGAVAPFEQPSETDNGYPGDFASKDSKSKENVSDDTKLNTKTPEENVSKEGSKNQNNSVGVDTKRTIHKKSSSNLR